MQRTNKYFHILDRPHLITRTGPATQDDHFSKAVADHRRSTDQDLFDLYDSWLALSPRERHVTYLACEGYKNDQIAFQMGVSVTTVKSYLQHVFLKIGVRNKIDLRLKFVNFDFKHNIPPHS